MEVKQDYFMITKEIFEKCCTQVGLVPNLASESFSAKVEDLARDIFQNPNLDYNEEQSVYSALYTMRSKLKIRDAIRNGTFSEQGIVFDNADEKCLRFLTERQRNEVKSTINNEIKNVKGYLE